MASWVLLGMGRLARQLSAPTDSPALLLVDEVGALGHQARDLRGLVGRARESGLAVVLATQGHLEAVDRALLPHVRDPEEGVTGYRHFLGAVGGGGGGTSRWGDYSAAVAAADGTLWVATEYIPKACSSAPQANCRTLAANWGAFVTHVTS